MPILVTCLCGAKLKAPDHKAGTRTACPKCGRPIALPTPSVPPVWPETDSSGEVEAASDTLPLAVDTAKPKLAMLAVRDPISDKPSRWSLLWLWMLIPGLFARYLTIGSWRGDDDPDDKRTLAICFTIAIVGLTLCGCVVNLHKDIWRKVNRPDQ